MMAHTYNASTQEVEIGWPEVQGYSHLHSQSEDKNFLPGALADTHVILDANKADLTNATHPPSFLSLQSHILAKTH